MGILIEAASDGHFVVARYGPPARVGNGNLVPIDGGSCKVVQGRSVRVPAARLNETQIVEARAIPDEGRRNGQSDHQYFYQQLEGNGLELTQNGNRWGEQVEAQVGLDASYRIVGQGVNGLVTELFRVSTDNLRDSEPIRREPVNLKSWAGGMMRAMENAVYLWERRTQRNQGVGEGLVSEELAVGQRRMITETRPGLEIVYTVSDQLTSYTLAANGVCEIVTPRLDECKQVQMLIHNQRQEGVRDLLMRRRELVLKGDEALVTLGMRTGTRGTEVLGICQCSRGNIKRIEINSNNPMVVIGEEDRPTAWLTMGPNPLNRRHNQRL